MFNKRHYEAFATLMQNECPPDYWDANKKAHHDVLISRMADMFQRDNSRFDRGRFIHACQPGSNVKARTAHLKIVAA